MTKLRYEAMDESKRRALIDEFVRLNLDQLIDSNLQDIRKTEGEPRCAWHEDGQPREFRKSLETVETLRGQGTFVGEWNSATSIPHGYGVWVSEDGTSMYEGYWK